MSDAPPASAPWEWEPEAIAAELERLGFDVDRAAARLPEGGGSLTARRDRGDRSQVVTVDAGGRLRARVTAVVAERGERRLIAGARLRVVTRSEAATTMTGTLSDRAQLAAIVAALDAVATPADAPDRPGAPARPW